MSSYADPQLNYEGFYTIGVRTKTKQYPQKSKFFNTILFPLSVIYIQRNDGMCVTKTLNLCGRKNISYQRHGHLNQITHTYIHMWRRRSPRSRSSFRLLGELLMSKSLISREALCGFFQLREKKLTYFNDNRSSVLIALFSPRNLRRKGGQRTPQNAPQWVGGTRKTRRTAASRQARSWCCRIRERASRRPVQPRKRRTPQCKTPPLRIVTNRQSRSCPPVRP